MTQTLTNDSRLKLAELETRSRKLLSESDLQKEEDVKIQLSHKLDVKLTVLYESRQLEKLDNNKGDEKRERELVAAYQVFTQGGGGHPVQTSGQKNT